MSFLPRRGAEFGGELDLGVAGDFAQLGQSGSETFDHFGLPLGHGVWGCLHSSRFCGGAERSRDRAATLKINLHIAQGDAYYVDTSDLYSARSRHLYIVNVAKDLAVREEIVKLEALRAGNQWKFRLRVRNAPIQTLRSISRCAITCST